jgi:hypothetical protein
MKAFNLNRIMMSCCVDIDNEYFEELHDFLMETDVDLNTLNIDDLVVNGVQWLSKEEAEEYDMYILKETEDGCWCL